MCIRDSCPPGEVEAIAAQVTAKGRRFVDAPVSGGVVGARAATLSIMVGAPDDSFAVAKPILDAMGDKVFHVGQSAGQGATVKTVNQLLCGVHIAVAAEALSLAEKAVPSHGFLRRSLRVTKSLRLPTVRFRASSRARRSGSVAASASAYRSRRSPTA